MARNSEDKGTWAEVADEGIVPDQLGEDRRDDEDPQLRSAVTGRETGSDVPATEEGIDREAGDRADAVTDGGAKRPEGAEPDLKDAAQPPRQVDA
jgi:hypothetical protein